MEEYCKVLIVDDERMIRKGIRHMADWEKEGFLIAGEAGDGQEALRLVRELAPPYCAGGYCYASYGRAGFL